MKAAAFQMRLGSEISANLDTIRRVLRDRAGKADVLAVPECALTGYLPSRSFAQAEVEEALGALRRDCRQHKIALAVGTAWREGRAVWNRAILLDRAGRIAGSYDKCCLTRADDGSGDTALFSPGRHLNVFRLGRTTVGLQICYDMRYFENWRILAQQGARVVFHLSSAAGSGAWKRPVLAGAIATRAAENGLFVVSANNALAPQMMASTINNPNGLVLAIAPLDRERVIEADLDLSAGHKWFYASTPAGRRPDLWARGENRRRLLHPKR